jgi:hypothetical protein
VKKSDLVKFLKNNQNVLMEGPHGVGKTALVKEVFNEAGLKWRYFSASTMDPFCDFIGVPRPTVNAQGETFLELIRPQDFAEDNIEALFFDEFNRADDKVLNAVMELIQFKSINGKKFNNLKVVWAAINPFTEDETYAVQRLDPAIKDRFQVQVSIPANFIDSKYFTKTYGEVSKTFIEWWREGKLHNLVSPRRLEYAVQAYLAESPIPLEHVLPLKSNVKLLKTMLKDEPVIPVEDEDSALQTGNYTVEQMEEAAEKKEKLALSLQSSEALLTPDLIKTKPHLLNYFHQESIFSRLEDPNIGKKLLINYCGHYNEDLSTNDVYLPGQVQLIKKLIKDYQLPSTINETDFFKKHLV